MLGKLLKYEFRATRRIMLPILAVFAVMIVLTPLLFASGSKTVLNTPDRFGEGIVAAVVIANMLIVFFYAMIAATALCFSQIFTVVRFRQGILGDEGYLTNTLPVTTEQKLLSKLLVGMVWITIGAFMAIISLMEYVNVMNGVSIFAIKQVFTNLGIGGILLTIAGILSFCRFYLIIFTAIAIGYSSDSGRLVKSIGVGFGIWLAVAVIENVIQAVYKRNGIGVLLYGGDLNYDLALTMILGSVITGTILFFVTRHFLEKRLNLQ